MSDDQFALEPDDSFETTLAKLQAVVSELEVGGIGLERSVELYKLGIELADRCEKLLSQAELVVKTINEPELLDEEKAAPQ